MTPARWFFLVMAVAAGILSLAWLTRRRGLLAQFLILLGSGVLISFLLLMIVQLPDGRPWLETLLVVTVFTASPIAVRLFLRALSSEEDEQIEETQK